MAFSEVDWTFSYLVPAGEYRLVASHPGYLRAEQVVTLSPGEVLVCSLGLDRAVSYDQVYRRANPSGAGRRLNWFADTVVAPLAEVVVEGRVVERGTGKPVAGACVFVERTDNGAVSDKDGRFRFKAPTGTRRLVAAYYWRYEQWDTTVILGFEPSVECRPVLRPFTVDVTVPPERRQSGVVFWNRLDGGDEEVGEGIGRVMGWFRDRTTGREAGLTEVWPDDRGETWLAHDNYLFELAPGTHVVKALKLDYEAVYDEVEVALGKTLRHDLSMVPLFLPESMPSHDRRAPRLDAGEPLFPAEDSGKWGYIDRQGRVVIEPRFKVAEPFSNGRAWVTEGARWGAIDRSGEYVIQPTYRRVGQFSEGLAAVLVDGQTGFIDRRGEFILLGDYTNVGEFHEGLARVGQGGRDGWVDSLGNWVIGPKFRGAGDFHEGRARIVGTGRGGVQKTGYIDRSGNVVVEPSYNNAGDFSCGFAPVNVQNGWAYIDRQGNRLPAPLMNIARGFSEGLAVVCGREFPHSHPRYGVIDTTGRLLVDYVYEIVLDFQDGMAAVKTPRDQGGKWGFIDCRGRVAIPPVYLNVRPFAEGRAAVSRDGKSWDYIDTAGRYVCNAGYSSESESRSGLAPFREGHDREGFALFGYADHSGRAIIPAQFRDAGPFHGEYAVVRDTVGAGWVTRAGRVITNPRFHRVWGFTDGLALVESDGRYGFADTSGAVVIPCRYVQAKSFRSGRASVETSSKWGFVDTMGSMAVLPVHENVGPFSEGLARASVANEEWREPFGWVQKAGYIDRSGKMVTEPDFARGGDFSEELAAVAVPDSSELLYGYIDRQGDWVVPPVFMRAQPFSEGLAAVMVFDSTSRWEDSAGGRWGSLVPDRGYEASGPRFGYINRQGRFIIPPVLHGAWPFSDGLAGVVRSRSNWGEGGRNWAYVDSAGTLAVESIWRLSGNTPGPFKEGLAAISEVQNYIDLDGPRFDGFGYYIDRSGRPAFTRTFNEVGDFEHGIARVKWRGHYHYIDRTGRFIW